MGAGDSLRFLRGWGLVFAIFKVSGLGVLGLRVVGLGFRLFFFWGGGGGLGPTSRVLAVLRVEGFERLWR